MKKHCLVTAVTALLLALASALTAVAATEYSDGVYTFVKTEYENALLTDCNLTDEVVEVPEFVLGYPVAGVGDYAFFANSYVREVTLPPAVFSIGEYAFANDTNLEAVTIPRWCESIADNAFWNSPNVTLRCRYGTAAYTYATAHEMAYYLLDGVKLGDTNGDGVVDISDATVIQRHLADLGQLEGIYLKAADTNGDGVYDVSDVTALQMFCADCVVPAPVGEVMTQ